MTIFTGHVSVSFKDKKSCGGGEGKALSIQFLSTPPNRQTACKQKFIKYDFVINVYAAFTYITKIKCDSMDQRDTIVSYKSNFISNEKC